MSVISVSSTSGSPFDRNHARKTLFRLLCTFIPFLQHTVPWFLYITSAWNRSKVNDLFFVKVLPNYRAEHWNCKIWFSSFFEFLSVTFISPHIVINVESICGLRNTTLWINTLLAAGPEWPSGVFWCKGNQKMGYVKGYKKALTNIKDTSNFTIVLLRTMVCVISRITT